MSDYISRFEDAVSTLEQESPCFNQFVFALHMMMEKLVASDTIYVFSFVTTSNNVVDVMADFKGDIHFDRTFYYNSEDK